MATDESTSVQRQREVITAWAEANSHNVIGWAEDIDVSGSVDPFDTPNLGNWLNHRADAFDVIACWKLDRISRSAIRLNTLIGWCLDHDKSLVSCSESIDISTPVGRLIVNVIAFLAEGELEAMRERQLSSRRKLREASRWPGGKPPYGYRIVDNPDGFGKVLAVDPHAYPVVRRIVDAVLDGVSLAQVCRDLNNDGVVSPADHYRVCNGEEDSGIPWRTGPLRHMLLSPTLVGHVHIGGVTVRDDKGNPVLMAKEPLVSDDERDLLATELHRAEGAPRERRAPALLAGVSRCWFCETMLTSTRQNKKLAGGKQKEYRYYRCPNECSPLMPMETVDKAFGDLLLGSLGDEPVTERVWVPGDSIRAELKAAVTAVDELSTAAAKMTSRTAKERLQVQLEALDARIAELEVMPSREGGYEERPTGETYRQAWERTAGDLEARRLLLKRIGADFRVGIHEGQLLTHLNRLGDRLPQP